jgi:O-methyltransferase domain/Dimerisation domain
MENTQQGPNPSKIMQIGMGFMASKTLLTAVKLNLFTLLAEQPLSGSAIKEKLSLHQRGLYDFLDALVSFGFLNRTGIKETAVYSNAEDTDLFLDAKKPPYLGGILVMANERLYPFWGDLEAGLKTGLPQNEVKSGGRKVFEELYADPHRLEIFVNAMAGIQMGNFMMFSNAFDFAGYKTCCDMGGAGGFLAAHIAMSNPHMNCITYDLAPVEPIAKKNIAHFGLTDRVKVLTGDFFTNDFPKVDVITMGNILHDWDEANKIVLMKKAYDALPEGGAFVAIENVIDNERSVNSFGLLMSLNMLIETESGFDYSGSDFEGWAKQAGFKKVVIMPLAGPSSAAIAYK